MNSLYLCKATMIRKQKMRIKTLEIVKFPFPSYKKENISENKMVNNTKTLIEYSLRSWKYERNLESEFRNRKWKCKMKEKI